MDSEDVVEHGSNRSPKQDIQRHHSHLDEVLQQSTADFLLHYLFVFFIVKARSDQSGEEDISEPTKESRDSAVNRIRLRMIK